MSDPFGIYGPFWRFYDAHYYPLSQGWPDRAAILHSFLGDLQQKSQ